MECISCSGMNVLLCSECHIVGCVSFYGAHIIKWNAYSVMECMSCSGMHVVLWTSEAGPLWTALVVPNKARLCAGCAKTAAAPPTPSLRQHHHPTR